MFPNFHLAKDDLRYSCFDRSFLNLVLVPGGPDFCFPRSRQHISTCLDCHDPGRLWTYKIKGGIVGPNPTYARDKALAIGPGIA